MTYFRKKNSLLDFPKRFNSYSTLERLLQRYHLNKPSSLFWTVFFPSIMTSSILFSETTFQTLQTFFYNHSQNIWDKLVFIWNWALQEKFTFCFSGDFYWYWQNFQFEERTGHEAKILVILKFSCLFLISWYRKS